MSVSSADSEHSASITAANVGEATNLLHAKTKGDLIGIRGPFGNSFQPVKGNVLLIGGGTGASPLVFLAERLVNLKNKITFLVGAKTEDELLFVSRIRNVFSETENKVVVSTEDGSDGLKGLVTDLAERIFLKERFNMVYACGPEAMLSKVFSLSENYETPLQASLERLMRCAIGLCGSCAIGEFRVCVDGPVFNSRQLREVKGELGHSKRDFDGKKMPV